MSQPAAPANTAQLVAGLAAIPTATIHEASGGRGALPSNLRPLSRGMSICAPALTVEAGPGDNLAIHHAIYAARPGEALLVDCGGYTEAGQWGGVMMEAAIARGIAGLITNGAVRDSDEIIARGFPVFAAGLCIKGTTKRVAGRIGEPITLGGVVIERGDIIRADSDGVVVVGIRDAAEVLAASRRREEKEAAIIAALRDGQSTIDLYGLDRP